tara:strand:- start:98 stop:445 length:348 start_codon:yes stop_codon:yes gene_type:complete
MSSTISCSFCIHLGIPAPHNHTVRNYKDLNKPIICPNLLNIDCTYCKKKGHTKKYCSLLNKKNNNVHNPNVNNPNVNNPNVNNPNLNFKRKNNMFDNCDNCSNKRLKNSDDDMLD